MRKLLAFVALVIAAPVALAQGSLSTGFAGTHASRGAYIDVTANRALSVTSFALNLAAGAATVTVYTKAGTTAGFEQNPGAWTVHATVNVTGNGQGTGTGVAIPSFPMASGETRAFYVVADTDGKLYNANGPTTSASNADMSLQGLYESHGLFATTYNGWGFQGTVCYDGGNCGAAVPPPVSTEPIPTMSEWALVATSIMVALLALGRFRRRNDTA